MALRQTVCSLEYNGYLTLSLSEHVYGEQTTGEKAFSRRNTNSVLK